MGTDLGKFQVTKVIDGDTINVDRPPMPAITPRQSLRFLNLDTEETHKPKDLGPVTAYGKEVTALAEKWYAERGNQVTLKTEGSLQLSDFYNRVLVQVFAGKDHYQQHAIANGWSPYYAKYGYSEEYHQVFAEAEAKAKRDKLGIWSDKQQKRAPRDSRPYDLLERWWNMRAERIKLAMDAQQRGDKLLILLNGRNLAEARQKAQNGEEAQVFGDLERTKGGEMAGSGLFILNVKLDVPFYVYVAADAKQRNNIIAHLEKTYLSNSHKLPDSLVKANFVFLRGKLTMYSNYGNQIPEIVINSLDQVGDAPFASV